MLKGDPFGASCCEERVLQEAGIIALRKVVAEMGAAALSPRHSGAQYGVGDGAQGASFGEAATSLPLLKEGRDAGFTFGQSVESTLES